MDDHVYWADGEETKTVSISIAVDETGVAEITHLLLCKDEAAAIEAMAVDAADIPVALFHPYVKGTSSDRIEAGMWHVTRIFSATISDNSDELFKVYSVETVANNEPIQTHPDFTVFAGVPGQPLNGAIFDPVSGEFVRFAPYNAEGEKNRKAGVTDYKVPIVSFSETRIVFEDELARYMSGAGFVDDTPPNHPLRPRFKKRNWLVTQNEPEWVAEKTYKLTRKWACSGPRGWDRLVYPPVAVPK